MLPPLTIIPAGAGSGKTHSIQEQLGEWVTAGLVSPGRIVAVTFTEAAAAELRERIRGKLLGLGRLEEALQLDEAYISTIHGFGLRLLSEFAFDAGLSPRPRLLNEDEQNALIGLALARSEEAGIVTSNLSGFGYSFNFEHKEGPEVGFRRDVLKVVSLLRSIGVSKEGTAHSQFAEEWIRQRYGTTGDATRMVTNLREAIDGILSAFPESMEQEFGKNDTAKKEFQRDYRNLKAAEAAEIALASDWKLWQQLRDMRKSKKGCKLPEGYDALADAVMEAASVLPGHPGPLDHAVQHIQTLMAVAEDVLSHYAQAKHEAGLVDYGDMIAMAVDLLRNRPEVLEELVTRIDCLVVDEFQDTNPEQFSLLWHLKEAGIPTVIVGDMKQAIMGFQGADPRLFSALIATNPQFAQPLPENWRSQPPLMDFINAAGSVLFGEAYIALKPKGKASDLDPLEIIEFDESATGKVQLRAEAVGARLKSLLDDPDQVIFDRRTKKTRRLRAGDVAILCPTNPMLKAYSSVLRAIGLYVKLREEGWYASRVVELVCQALAYVANPADRHAALYLSVTELGGLELEEALKQLILNRRIDDPLLSRLDALASNLADQTLYSAVAQVISALQLFEIISLWPDADQSRVNLLRLQAEASEYMDSNREALASGGYHGAGIKSFLAWLKMKVQLKDKDYKPDPRVLDEDSVELITWHSSKGREWPVVFVCGMDTKRNPRQPNIELGYQSFDDLLRLMDHSIIEYSPKFAAPEANERFLKDLRPSQSMETKRLVYVAMTRAREKLVMEWPSYPEGKGGSTFWSVLAPQVEVSLEESQITVGDQSFPCSVWSGSSLQGNETLARDEQGVTRLAATGRRAIRKADPQKVPAILSPDSVTPSGLVAAPTEIAATNLSLERYKNHDGLDAVAGLAGTELGNLLHRCFEVLGANSALAEELGNITGVSLSEQELHGVGLSVSSFETWMADHFDPKAVQRELPLLGTDDNGSVISGTADLVVELDGGVWVIDHKSDYVEDPVLAFGAYRVQLECYCKLLQDAGYEVLGMGINWIRLGEIVLVRFS